MHLPAPLRAAVGLAATAAAEAKHLPDRAIELPMLAVSTALQMSLRAQQRYAWLAERGDDVLNGRKVSDEPPPWATFDDPLGDFPSNGASPGEAAQASTRLAHLFGTAEPTLNGTPLSDALGAESGDDPDDERSAGPDTRSAVPAEQRKPRRAAPRKTAAKRAGAGKAVRKPRNTAPSKFDAVEDD